MLAPMGFSNIERFTFVSVLDGKMSVRVPKGTPGAITRVNKMGAEVSELRYDQLSGDLVAFNHRTTPKYGIEFLIDIEDGGKKYQIQVPWSSRYTKEFLCCAPKFNIKVPITFRPYKFKPDDNPTKTISGWTIFQNGSRVLSAYPKDKIPAMVQVKVKGQLIWDDSDQMAFLWDAANSWGMRSGLFDTVAEQVDQSEQPMSADDIPEEFA